MRTRVLICNTKKPKEKAEEEKLGGGGIGWWATSEWAGVIEAKMNSRMQKHFLGREQTEGWEALGGFGREKGRQRLTLGCK